MNQILNDEQLSVIHQMLLKSPPGELYLVLKEIEDFLEGATIPSAFLENSLKEYNLTYHSLIDIPESSKPVVIVGSINDDSNVYQDVLNKRSYQFNHLNNTIDTQMEYEDKPSTSQKCEALRQVLLPELKQYLSQRFCKQSAAYIECDGDHMEFFIVGEMVKLSSYYTGRWVSHYSVDLGNSDIHLIGEVDIRSHYFENGNVQMSVHRELEPVVLNLSDKSGCEIMDAVGSFEDSLQTGLKDTFSSLQKDALKDFRRQLPHTRQHFQWNVNAHVMADTMRELKK